MTNDEIITYLGDQMRQASQEDIDRLNAARLALLEQGIEPPIRPSIYPSPLFGLLGLGYL